MANLITLSTWRATPRTGTAALPQPDSGMPESAGSAGTHFPFDMTEQETRRLLWDTVGNGSVKASGTLIVAADPSGFWHIESPIPWEAPLVTDSAMPPSIVDEVTTPALRVFTYNRTWTMPFIGTFDDAIDSTTGDPVPDAPIEAVFHALVSVAPGKFFGRFAGQDSFWPEISVSLSCQIQLTAPYVSADASLPDSPPEWSSTFPSFDASDYYAARTATLYLPPPPGVSLSVPNEAYRIIRGGEPSGNVALVTPFLASGSAAPTSFLEIDEFKWFPSASFQTRTI